MDAAAGTGRSILNAVTFTNDSTAIAVGSGGRVFRSSDRGNTWALVYNGGQSQRSLFSVSFGDALSGVAVGSLGVTVGTTDGGQTWEQRSIGAAPLLRGVWLTTPTGIAVGDGGTMLKTIDGGASWELHRWGDRGAHGHLLCRC